MTIELFKDKTVPNGDTRNEHKILIGKLKGNVITGHAQPLSHKQNWHMYNELRITRYHA
jgi:hypothetical protein